MRGLVYLSFAFIAFVLAVPLFLAKTAGASIDKPTYSVPVDDAGQLPAGNLSEDVACRWRPFRRRRCCYMNSDQYQSIAVATFDASASLQG